jgi:hypothetical protein
LSLFFLFPRNLSGISSSSRLCVGAPGSTIGLNQNNAPGWWLTGVGSMKHHSTLSSPSLHATELRTSDSRSETMEG